MEETNKVLSIIAFYLSEYDMAAVTKLGFKTRSEAITTISRQIGNGNNYLKLRRDEFDALPDSASSRKGWRNRPPLKDVVDLAEYLHQFSFEELTEIVAALIENRTEVQLPFNGESLEELTQELSEEEIEEIINSEDNTAQVVLKTQLGRQRVYKKSIIRQLKKLYRGNCQICGNNPFSEFGINLCEAHHISYFAASHNNNASNIIIICPNHHKLIHALNPCFRKETLSFFTNGREILKIRINYHLKD